MVLTSWKLKRVCSQDQRIQLVVPQRAMSWARTLPLSAALGYICSGSARLHRLNQVSGHCNSSGYRLASLFHSSFFSCFLGVIVVVVDLVRWDSSIFCSCSCCQGMKEVSGGIRRGLDGKFPLQFSASCVWLVWESMRDEHKFREGYAMIIIHKSKNED